MLTLALLLAGCSSEDGRKHWILWEEVELPGQAGELGVWPFAFCGPDHFLYGDQLYQLSTGERVTSMGATPSNPVTGAVGSVTCTEDALFTAPPLAQQGWISRDAGPWEQLDPGATELFVTSVMADSQGLVWRTLYAASAASPPQLERSFDQGETWERVEWTPINPSGRDAVEATLVRVEVYLDISVVDSERQGGLVRLDVDGDRSLVTLDSFDVSYESPAVNYSFDDTYLATYVFTRASDLPAYHFGQLYYTDRDPFERSAYDYEPILALGAIVPNRRAPVVLEDAIAQAPDGHLYMGLEDGLLRSSLPWTESARDEVLLGRGCELLEWRSERYDDDDDGDGPGEVVFSHSGGEPMLIAALGRQSPDWLNPESIEDGRYVYDLVDPGETLTVTSEREPVLILDDLGRCRGVLRAGDGGEVDLGEL
ncbi:MAG: hypothetical protein H6741_07925 [Alphaproteobacteria bacterium]|nr:hypothetical protein [Alphaproteobacteria bacterium]